MDCIVHGAINNRTQQSDFYYNHLMHELLIAKYRLKLKKIGKNTRPSRYDLNQIPYNYTVEMTNRFKELDLINRVPEELSQRFMTLYRRQ